MIDYHDWLSNDDGSIAHRQRRNEAKAARAYAALKPLRTATGWLASAVRARWHAWRCAQLRKAGLQEMRALNDRLLDDIGLSRADLVALESVDPHNVPAEAIARRAEAAAGRRAIEPTSDCELIELELVRLARDERQRGDGDRRRRGTRNAA